MKVEILQKDEELGLGDVIEVGTEIYIICKNQDNYYFLLNLSNMKLSGFYQSLEALSKERPSDYDEVIHKANTVKLVIGG